MTLRAPNIQQSLRGGRRSTKQSHGFTLIETLGALVVFTCFFLAIISMVSLSYRGSKTLHYDVLAEQVMGTKMSELRLDLYNIPAPSSGIETVDGIDFAWTVEVLSVSDPRLKDTLREIHVSCSWEDPTGEKQRIRRTLISFPEAADPPPPTPNVSTTPPSGPQSHGGTERKYPLPLGEGRVREHLLVGEGGVGQQ